MIRSKRTSILAVATVALGLLLFGAARSWAQATQVIQQDGNVTRILNLLVITDQKEEVWDVEFVYDTGYNVYGRALNFRWENEENATAALASVAFTLNGAFPVPEGASIVGTDTFFIGVEEVNQSDLIGAVGSERFDEGWGRAERHRSVSRALQL